MKPLEIINVYVERINEKRKTNITVEEYTEQLLKDYYNDVSNAELNDYDSQIHNDVEIIKDSIIKCLQEYKRANIGESIKIMKDLIDRYQDKFTHTIDKERYWYRMRKTDKQHRVFPANEMFHLPFELRGKVANQRFSISGYPCLYLGRTSYACWEEMHQPALADICVSALKNIESFKVLDLRIPKEPLNPLKTEEIENWLIKLPLILACSVKVLNDDDVFKSEYIIPQLVMLSIANNKDILGCYYISTRRNSQFSWPLHNLINLALPVKEVDNKGLCKKLRGLFEITDSTCYEYELIKGNIQHSGLYWDSFDDNTKVSKSSYVNSIWGQIDYTLKKRKEYS